MPPELLDPLLLLLLLLLLLTHKPRMLQLLTHKPRMLQLLPRAQTLRRTMPTWTSTWHACRDTIEVCRSGRVGLRDVRGTMRPLVNTTALELVVVVVLLLLLLAAVGSLSASSKGRQ